MSEKEKKDIDPSIFMSAERNANVIKDLLGDRVNVGCALIETGVKSVTTVTRRRRA